VTRGDHVASVENVPAACCSLPAQARKGEPPGNHESQERRIAVVRGSGMSSTLFFARRFIGGRAIPSIRIFPVLHLGIPRVKASFPFLAFLYPSQKTQ
jgi:hypothetical protein